MDKLFSSIKNLEQNKLETIGLLELDYNNERRVILINPENIFYVNVIFLNKEFEYIRSEFYKISLDDLCAAIINDSFGGKAFAKLALRSIHRKDIYHVLSYVIERFFICNKKEPNFLLGTAILYRQKSEINDSIKLINLIDINNTLDCDLYIDAIEYILLGSSPIQPNIAIEKLHNLISLNKKNSSFKYRAMALCAYSHFLIGDFLKAKHIYYKCKEGDSLFMSSKHSIQLAMCLLAEDKISESLLLLREIVEVTLKHGDVSLPCILYKNILKLTDQEESFNERLFSEDLTDNYTYPDIIIALAVISDSVSPVTVDKANCIKKIIEYFLRVGFFSSKKNNFYILNLIYELLYDFDNLEVDKGLCEERFIQLSMPYMATSTMRHGSLIKKTQKKCVKHRRFKEKNKKTIALTFSGFIRDYSHAQQIKRAINNIGSNYNVYTFFYIFDRLGNISIPRFFPKKYFDYTNGGFFREISKTKPLNESRFVESFCPSAWKIVPRMEDSFYMSNIGMNHPQWLMVYNAFLLAENFAHENNINFDFFVRARTDNFPQDPFALRRAVNDPMLVEEKSSILVMSRWSLGHFRLSDRFAIGDFESLKKYCEIGKDRNFISIEKMELWRNEIQWADMPLSEPHESYLGCWLKVNGINFYRRPYLDAEHLNYFEAPK